MRLAKHLQLLHAGYIIIQARNRHAWSSHNSLVIFPDRRKLVVGIAYRWSRNYCRESFVGLKFTSQECLGKLNAKRIAMQRQHLAFNSRCKRYQLLLMFLQVKPFVSSYIYTKELLVFCLSTSYLAFCCMVSVLTYLRHSHEVTCVS